MRLVILALALTLVPGLAAAREATGTGPGALRLEEVLIAVDTAYPLLRAVEADRLAATGGLRSARGGFDTLLRADGDLRPAGFYENYAGGAAVEQATRLWGARFFAGYRVGRGTFPAYDGYRHTNSGGEVFGGMELPLLRGGSIDGPRARLAQAELDVSRADVEVTLQRIAFRREAALAYWGWLAAQLGVAVEERLLEVAEARQGQIAGRVTRGALPRVDLADNERLIVARRIRLREAERSAREAAIGLSLFLRDGDGNPVVVERERTPADFPAESEPDPAQATRDIERALEAHPLLTSLALETDRAEVDLALARNDTLPSIRLRLEGSRDGGSAEPGISSEGSISPDPRGETEAKVLLRFELPVQRREARGRALKAKAQLDRLSSEQRFARDRIAAEIQRAMANLEAAFAQTTESRRNLELARQLESAEERRRTLGTSNLINVNIRELQTAESNRALIRTQADYFRALARYRAAVAMDL